MKENQKKKVNQLSILNFVKIVPKNQNGGQRAQQKLETINIDTESEDNVGSDKQVQAQIELAQQHKKQPIGSYNVSQVTEPSSISPSPGEEKMISTSPPFIIRPQSSPQINSPSAIAAITSPEINLNDLKRSRAGNDSPGSAKFDATNLTQHQNAKPQPNSKYTPAQKQYYALREQLDSSTILFIQNGHFYELYDDDCCFGVEFLNLKGVKKASGQFVAGVPMVEKVSFYFQKTLLLGRNIAIAHQSDEMDSQFKIQARKLDGVYSLSCQSFFDLEDISGLLYVHKVPQEGTHILFYDYLSNNIYMNYLNQDKTLRNDLYEIILRVKPAELIIFNDEQLKSELQLLLSKQFNTLIVSLPENYYQQYISKSRFKNYQIRDQIQEVKQFKLLNDYLTYLNVYPGQHTENSNQNLKILRNNEKFFNLPFTTVQTLQLMDVEKVYKANIQTTSGKLYLHKVFTVLCCDRELVKQNHKILEILNKDNNQIKFRSFQDISNFKTNNYNNKHAYSIIYSIKQLKYYIDQAVSLFKLEIPEGYDYLTTFVTKINKMVNLDQKAQQVVMNESDMKALQQLEQKHKIAQCEFLNGLRLQQVTNPVFTGGYGSNAAKTAFGFTPNNVLVVGRSIIDKSQVDKLIHKLNNQDAMRSADFIETSANCHKFTTPQFLVDSAEKIENFKEQHLNQYLQEIMEEINQNKSKLQKLYELIGRIDFLQAAQKLKNQYSDVQWCISSIYGDSYVQNEETIQFVMEEFTHVLCLQKKNFIPLSFVLTHSSNVLTGPNMSGKSTLLRAICLALLLSQAGVYVPAKRLSHSLIEQLLARVGGYDLGHSTFQTEMIDTAQILSLCGPRSVVVLDEVGRGTETISSDAISQGILKFLKEKRSFSIISSHSQQLRLCAHTLNSGVYYMDWDFKSGTQEDNKQQEQTNGKRINFKYTVVEVESEREAVKSMGCEVAEIAGVNLGVIERAKQLRALMERTVQVECQRCVKGILEG